MLNRDASLPLLQHDQQAKVEEKISPASMELDRCLAATEDLSRCLKLVNKEVDTTYNTIKCKARAGIGAMFGVLGTGLGIAAYYVNYYGSKATRLYNELDELDKCIPYFNYGLDAYDRGIDHAIRSCDSLSSDKSSIPQIIDLCQRVASVSLEYCQKMVVSCAESCKGLTEDYNNYNISITYLIVGSAIFLIGGGIGAYFINGHFIDEYCNPSDKLKQALDHLNST